MSWLAALIPLLLGGGLKKKRVVRKRTTRKRRGKGACIGKCSKPQAFSTALVPRVVPPSQSLPTTHIILPPTPKRSRKYNTRAKTVGKMVKVKPKKK